MLISHNLSASSIFFAPGVVGAVLQSTKYSPEVLSTSLEEQRYTDVSAPLSLFLAKIGEANLIKEAKKGLFLFWVPIDVETNPGWRELEVNPWFSYN